MSSRARRLEPAHSLLHGPLTAATAPGAGGADASTRHREHPLAAPLLVDADALPGGPLNPEQALALRRALADPLMLLWGPPGTGKTRVLAAVVRALAVAAGMAGKPLRLLIATAAYAALDKLLGDVAGAVEASGAPDVAPLLPGLGLYRLAGRSARPLRDRRVGDAPEGVDARAWLFSLLEAAAVRDTLAAGEDGPPTLDWPSLTRRVLEEDAGQPPAGPGEPGGPGGPGGAALDALRALVARTATMGLDRQAVGQALALADRHIVVGSVAGQLFGMAGMRGAGTWNGARWFDVAVLDEASQLPVADAATLFCTLREGARLIVAGDHRQLGPVRRLSPGQDGLSEPSGLYARAGTSATHTVNESRPAPLDSIFAHLQATHGVEPVQLVRNYRTNEAIAVWPRRRFYGGRYLADAPNRRLRLASAIPATPRAPTGWPSRLPWSTHWAAVLDPELPVVILTYPDRRHTLSNPFEAQVVAALASLLHRHLPRAAVDRDLAPGAAEGEALRRFWAEQVAIVTPHRAQLSLITNLLVTTGAFPRRPVPQVATVDAVQGQEREVVLASYGASDPDFIAAEAPFLLDPRRFNVTLTRARTKFVALLSDSLLHHLPADRVTAARAGDVQLFVLRHCRPAAAFWLPYQEGTRARTMPVRLRAPRVEDAAEAAASAPARTAGPPVPPAG
jgi:hypothetical protein